MTGYIEVHELQGESPVLINVEYICSVREGSIIPYQQSKRLYGAEIEYEGGAGYRTRTTLCKESYTEVSGLIHAAITKATA